MEHTAYAHRVRCAESYLRPGLDSGTVTAHLNNPDGHGTRLTAFLRNDLGVLVDSIRLYDDGLHGDSLAGDGLCGARFTTPPTTEDHYSLSLTAYDLTNGIPYELTQAVRFTTTGPVVCVGDTSNNKVPQWGLTVAYRFKVGNTGTIAVTPSIGGKIRSLDTAATIVSGSTFTVGDIAPGQVRLSSPIGISFSNWGSGTRDLLLELVFSSNAIEYWRDTIAVRVVDPTGIVQEQKMIPKTCELGQNYPNPFNPSTTIRYGLPHKSAVQLTVFNTLGQQVAQLVNGDMEAGYHEVRFDGKNLSSGVYFYRIQAGEFVASKRLLLLK
jgi:hypothetical protein